MAGLGKKAGGGKGEKSIETLRAELKECVENIRKDKVSDDVRKLDEETKQRLRNNYRTASALAAKIASLTTDDDEAEKRRKNAKDWSEAAQRYGSKVESKIPDTTFDDVKGLDGVKKIVKSFMFILNHGDISRHYKIEGGLGMLMYGAPGTGKTLFAEALAHELNLPLIKLTPADIFNKYVGGSEQNIKQVFDEMDACPDGAILFVDECESIFSRRTDDEQDYKAAVTTQLLQNINGFGGENSKRILIAATNRPDMIDPAYLRHKRFSHLVHVPPPDAEAKLAIIESKLAGIELDGITVEEILEMTERTRETTSAFGEPVGVRDAYYSAADICGIIEEACRLAIEIIQANEYSAPIPLTRAMFETAFDKIKPSISASLLAKYENFDRAAD